MLHQDISPMEPAAGLAQLTSILLAATDFESVALDVARTVSRMLPGRPGIRIILRRPGMASTVVSTGVAGVPAGARVIHAESARAVGVVVLYTELAAPHDRRVAQLLVMIADQLGILLSFVIETAHRVELVDRLRGTLAQQSVLDQAIGIVMGQRRCDHDEALSVLRATAARRQLSIARFAASVIRAATGHAPEDLHFVDFARTQP